MPTDTPGRCLALRSDLYKVSIKEYSILNICIDQWDRAVIQSFLSWKETTHDLVWDGVLYASKQYFPHFIRIGMSNVVPLDKLLMPQLPVWMVTLLTPNCGLLKQFHNPEQLIETLNSLEVSVAWTVLVDYANVNYPIAGVCRGLNSSPAIKTS